MKKVSLVVAAMCFATFSMTSCGSKKESNEEKEKTEDAYDDYAIAEPQGEAEEDVLAQGKTLVENSDCKTCHHPTNKLVGPAHMEVAKKYDFTEANVKMLAQKIINGGSGNWGDIMMVPHPALSESDAEKMSSYILSMDGEKLH